MVKSQNNFIVSFLLARSFPEKDKTHLPRLSSTVSLASITNTINRTWSDQHTSDLSFNPHPRKMSGRSHGDQLRYRKREILAIHGAIQAALDEEKDPQKQWQTSRVNILNMRLSSASPPTTSSSHPEPAKSIDALMKLLEEAEERYRNGLPPLGRSALLRVPERRARGQAYGA